MTAAARILRQRLDADSLPSLPAEITTLTFRPGVSRVAWEQLTGASLVQILQAAGRALSLAPAQLEIEPPQGREGGGDLSALKPGTRSAWILGPAIHSDGRPEIRRLCRIDGVSAPWLEIALRSLQASGWQPARSPELADLKRRQGLPLTPAEQALLSEI